MARKRTKTRPAPLADIAGSINELAGLAAAKDIDTAMYIAQMMARQLGIDESDLPIIAELRAL